MQLKSLVYLLRLNWLQLIVLHLIFFDSILHHANLFLDLNEAIHLGTNSILLDNSTFMGILHVVLPGQRRYHNLIYLFDATPPYSIYKIVKTPLQLPLHTITHGFMYTSSLAVVNNSIVIGYNVNDRTSSIVQTPISCILGMLGGDRE